jgi:hypothetical protein
MVEKHINKVCHCEKCGNESEMVITCELPEELETTEKAEPEKGSDTGETATKKVKGTAHCQNCGNEADMWIDY